MSPTLAKPKPPAARTFSRAATAAHALPPRERHRDEGGGRRLTLAFQALEAFPALAESRRRVLAAVSKDHVASADLVSALESDAALLICVLRFSNRLGSGAVDSAGAATALLSGETVAALAGRVPTFELFQRAGAWERAPERFRLHALAVQHAAERIALELGHDDHGRLFATSMLHDIGKLVLIHAHSGYGADLRGTPGERVRQERREIGIDHALVGGVLVRRWGLPSAIASAIERHHDADAEGEAAVIALADQLAHYHQGARVSVPDMQRSAAALGLAPERLRNLVYELPTLAVARRRELGPCPLSGRERSVLRSLAKGNVYKEIARELSLSASTVRSHLHNIYGKLGAADRAQAVLMADAQGWI